MTTFANILPNAETGGMPYAAASPLTTTEADLYNISPAAPAGAPPIPLPFHSEVLAEVSIAFTATGTSPTYVVMQTDFGDGVWYDLAWAYTTTVTGTVNFILSSGAGNAGAIQQTRAAGTAPASAGSNNLGVGARIRFVGKTGANNKATVTINYNALARR